MLLLVYSYSGWSAWGHISSTWQISSPYTLPKSGEHKVDICAGSFSLMTSSVLIGRQKASKHLRTGKEYA